MNSPVPAGPGCPDFWCCRGHNRLSQSNLWLCVPSADRDRERRSWVLAGIQVGAWVQPINRIPLQEPLRPAWRMLEIPLTQAYDFLRGIPASRRAALCQNGVTPRLPSRDPEVRQSLVFRRRQWSLQQCSLVELKLIRSRRCGFARGHVEIINRSNRNGIANGIPWSSTKCAGRMSKRNPSERGPI